MDCSASDPTILGEGVERNPASLLNRGRRKRFGAAEAAGRLARVVSLPCSFARNRDGGLWRPGEQCLAALLYRSPHTISILRIAVVKQSRRQAGPRRRSRPSSVRSAGAWRGGTIHGGLGIWILGVVLGRDEMIIFF